MQHLYFPAGVIDVQNILRFEVKEKHSSKPPGFRIYTNERSYSLVAPSALALAEWCVPSQSVWGPMTRAGSYPRG